MKKKIGKSIFSLAMLIITNSTFAESYSIPNENESLIGNIEITTANSGDTVVTVAKRYNIGFNALENANPYLNMGQGFQPGTPLTIPKQHLLPNQIRKGIVINLPEMRMYYFPEGTNKILTYPIGIGKTGKTIPITNTKITRKTKNPIWIPPPDIREFNLKQGIVLPRIMPAGPDNPLGPYAIYTALPTYLIHSTIFPESVGKRASFGCIRMYESDIEDFFPSVKSGIPVVILNSPIKIGWQQDQLYMEAHEPLEEHKNAYDASLPGTVHILNEMTKNQSVLVDWQAVAYITEETDGIPHQIGIRIH